MSFEYNPRTENPRRILRSRLGLQLFARRHDQQLTLEYVARRTGLKAEVIDRIEIGKGNVAWGDLLALTGISVTQTLRQQSPAGS